MTRRERVVVAPIFLIVTFMFAYLPTVLSAGPLNALDWNNCRDRYRAAEMRGDFISATEILRELYSRCRQSLGDEHPDTLVVAAGLREHDELRRLDAPTKAAFVAMTTTRFRGWNMIDDLARATFPDVDTARELVVSFRTSFEAIPPEIPREAGLEPDFRAGLGRVAAMVCMFRVAKPHLSSARREFAAQGGDADFQTRLLELMLSAVLKELQEEPEEQTALLRSNIEYADRYQVTPRLKWHRERAMVQLAECYYCLGNRNEADRLYAEVRARLPEKVDHELVGWCKSWCDRHEARQLMEKGDWDGAYEKILQARVGTIEYGHRNLSKGLTLERILRMSAEIQRQRGNDKEAEDDLQYAQSLANHAAKLREALEAELKAFDLTGDQGSPAAEDTATGTAAAGSGDH